MSNSIDQHIVGLDFDTSKFDKGIAQAESGLSKFQAGLNNTKSVSALSKVEQALGKVGKAFGPIGSAVQAGFSSISSAASNLVSDVSSKLSMLGTIGKITFAGMTAAVAGMIASGGIKRAMNIEQAKFQLRGLGADVDEIMRNVNDAVTGTAYGLDQAAVVASQLTASGVESGERMTSILKGVAGVAAMTGRDFADIGHIFTTVAGQGRMMTMQLRQLELSGINAAAKMAEMWGITEEEVRDMVTKGEVSFEMFSSAMSEAFGEHATKANETFTGSLSNVKAALSRIGEKFAAPSLEYLRDIFNSLRLVINEVNSQLTPLVDLFTKWAGGSSRGVIDFLNGFNSSLENSKVVAESLEFVTGILDRFFTVISHIGGSALDAIPNYFKNLTGFSNDIGKLGLGLNDVFNKLEAVSLGFDDGPLFKDFDYKELQQAGKAIDELLRNTMSHDSHEKVLNNFKEAFPEIAHRADVLGLSLSELNSEIGVAMDFIEQDPLGHMNFEQLQQASELVQAILKTTPGEDRSKAIAALREQFPELAKTVRDSSMTFGELRTKIDEATASGEGPFTSFINNFRVWASNLEFTNEQIQAFNAIRTGFSKGLDSIGVVLSGLFDGIVAAGLPALDFVVSKALPDLVNGLSGFFESIGGHLPSAQEFADTLRNIGQNIGNFFTALKNGDVTFLNGIKDALSGFFGPLIEAARNSGILSALSKVATDLFNVLFGPHEGELTLGKLARQALDFFGNIPSMLGDALRSIGTFIKSFMSDLGLTFGDIFNAINTGMTIGFFLKVVEALHTFSEAVKTDGKSAATLLSKILTGTLGESIKRLIPNFDKISDKVTGFIDNLQGSVNNAAKSNFPQNVLKIAISIGILAGALWLLSTIDPTKLVLPIAAIAGLFGGIIALMEALESTFKDWNASKLGAFASLAAIIFSIAAATLLLSIAVAALGHMDPTKLAQGMAAVGVAIFGMVKALEIISDFEKGPFIQAGAALMGIATAMLLLVIPIEILGHTDFWALVQGLASIGIVLAAMVGSLIAISKWGDGGKMLAGAFAMAGIASALLVMAAAIKIVGSMSWEQLTAAFFGLGTALIALGGAIEMLNKADIKVSQIVKIAAMFGLLIGALTAFTAMIVVFASLGIEGVLTGLVGLVGGLAILIGALYALSEINKGLQFETLAMELAAMGLALFALAGALTIMGSLSLEEMGVALLGLGGGLLMLALAAAAMKNASSGAVAMFVMASAMLVLAPALMLLSSIDIGNLAASLVLVGVAVGLFALAASALAGAVPAMFLIATAFEELGIGAAAIGVGLLAAAVAITILAGIAAPKLQEIIGTATDLVPAITGFVEALLLGLASLIPAFTAVGIAIMTSFLAVIRSALPELASTGVALVLMLVQGLTYSLPALVEAGFQLIITFVNSLAETIRSQHDAMYEAGKNLFLALLEAMLDTLAHLHEDLGNFIMDLPAIISGEKSLFESAGSDAASGAVTGAQNQFAQLPDIGANGMEMFFSSMGGKIDNGSMASMFAPISENASLAMSDLGSISEQGASDFKLPWENIGSDIDLSSLGTSMTGSLEGVDFGSVASGKMSELLAPFQDTSGMSAAGVALGEAASSGFDQGAAEMVQNADSKTGEAVSSVDSHSGSANSAGYSVGSNIGSGVYYGIDAWVSSVAEKAAEMVRAAKEAADAEAASASPSKEMIKRGKWFGQGFEIGIRGMIPAVAGTSADMVAAGKSAIGDSYSLMSDYVRRIDWDVNPTIRPVLDLTDVQSGMSQLQGIMSTYDSMRIGAFGRIVGNSTEGAASNIQNAPTYNFNLDYSSGDDAVTMFMELASMMQSFNRLEA